jgi:hypothetical protein
MLESLIVICLLVALLPAVMTAVNLRFFRALPVRGNGLRPRVSVLIPARDEELRIEASVRAALASVGVELELIVLDDHSADRTAAIVGEFIRIDSRLRLETAPALPSGWCGKQHACHVLAARAHHPLLVFMDADVRIAPDALARIAACVHGSDRGMISGFPRQETGTFLEELIIPLIHFLLLGFLPIWRMRRSPHPAFGAGCGQLICVRREAYDAAGGHAAIRASLHDGLTLPRAFRRAGIMTDLFDATDMATCRMYHSAGELWRGFSKNAHEGMATLSALPVWSFLLLGGQVLPLVLLPIGILAQLPTGWLVAATITVTLSYATRLVLARRFEQSWLGAAMHPLGIVILVALQWSALVNRRRGRPAVWRARAYSR